MGARCATKNCTGPASTHGLCFSCFRATKPATMKPYPRPGRCDDCHRQTTVVENQLCARCFDLSLPDDDPRREEPCNQTGCPNLVNFTEDDSATCRDCRARMYEQGEVPCDGCGHGTNVGINVLAATCRRCRRINP